MSIDVPKQKTLQESLVEEENDIRRRFEGYKDVEFQIYQDSICNHFKLGHLNGYPEYFSFLKEVDYMLQYAILKEVDTIICFDKSARGFGLLANKLLPIVRLERAKMLGVDPNTIKKPEIRFVDFPRLDSPASVHKFEEITDLVSKISGDKVLLFDESSYNQTPTNSLWEIDRGQEPNRWNFLDKEELVDRFGEDLSSDNIPYINKRSNIEGVRTLLSVKLSNKKFYYQIGTSNVTGGLDDGSRKILSQDLYLRHFLYSVENDDGNLLASKFKVTDSVLNFLKKFQKIAPDDFKIVGYNIMDNDQKINAVRDWISRFSQQVRDEHSRMAWELFKQVILKDDPYKRD